MDTNRDNDPTERPAPPKLVLELCRTQAQRVFVPPTVDEAILRAAHKHLAPAPQSRRGFLASWFRWPTFAAACALLFALVYRFSYPDSPSEFAPLYAREDLNRDGRVDILDAFQLARQLESGVTPVPNADVNSDGVIDRRDAEIIAAQAVKLEKGGRS